jgi:hypothetical protein
MTVTAHDITRPPVAGFVDDRQQGPPPYRIVLGTKRVIGDIEVQTSVTQFAADGSVDQVGLVEARRIHVRSVGREDLTVGQARELAGAIISAADELDSVNS